MSFDPVAPSHGKAKRRKRLEKEAANRSTQLQAAIALQASAKQLAKAVANNKPNEAVPHLIRVQIAADTLKESLEWQQLKTKL